MKTSALNAERVPSNTSLMASKQPFDRAICYNLSDYINNKINNLKKKFNNIEDRSNQVVMTDYKIDYARRNGNLLDKFLAFFGAKFSAGTKFAIQNALQELNESKRFIHEEAESLIQTCKNKKELTEEEEAKVRRALAGFKIEYARMENSYKGLLKHFAPQMSPQDLEELTQAGLRFGLPVPPKGRSAPYIPPRGRLAPVRVKSN